MTMITKPRATRVLAVVLAVSLWAPASPAQESGEPAADWPWFRGRNRDGVVPAADLDETWPSGGPPTLWRVPLGSGFASVVVAGPLLFTSFGSRDSEYLAAFSASDGSERWRLRIGDLFRDAQGDGPRSTPAVDGGLVFALGGQGVLVAAEIGTGRPVWRIDLGDAYGATGPTWGFSSQPMIVGERILLDVGGRSGAGVVAFDKTSGREVWRSPTGKPGYASPILVDAAGTAQAIFFTGEGVTGLDPADGAVAWRVPWSTSYDVHAATPIFVPPDRVFVSSGYGTGAALLRVDANGAEPVWRTREMKNQFSSSVVLGDYLYGFDNAILTCLDIRDGQRLWRARGYGHGSLIVADGKLVILSDQGRLALVQATPGEHVEIASTPVFAGKAWTPPALADGILYLRDEHEMAAIQLATAPSLVGTDH